MIINNIFMLSVNDFISANLFQQQPLQTNETAMYTGEIYKWIPWTFIIKQTWTHKDPSDS